MVNPSGHLGTAPGLPSQKARLYPNSCNPDNMMLEMRKRMRSTDSEGSCHSDNIPSILVTPPACPAILTPIPTCMPSRANTNMYSMRMRERLATARTLLTSVSMSRWSSRHERASLNTRSRRRERKMLSPGTPTEQSQADELRPAKGLGFRACCCCAGLADSAASPPCLPCSPSLHLESLQGSSRLPCRRRWSAPPLHRKGSCCLSNSPCNSNKSLQLTTRLPPIHVMRRAAV